MKHDPGENFEQRRGLIELGIAKPMDARPVDTHRSPIEADPVLQSREHPTARFAAHAPSRAEIRAEKTSNSELTPLHR